MLNLTKIAVSAALLCGVSACSASVETASVEDTQTVAKHDHSSLHDHSAVQSAEAKPEAGTYYATVKPGASITLNSVLPKSMTSGSYQTVRLQLQDGYSDGIMSVNIEPSAGLTLFGGTSAKTFNMAGPGPHIWDVDVKADADGVYFLNVFSEAQGQPRSFSVRLDMGLVTQKMLDDVMPAQGELIDGGKIRVLEATETIR